MNGVGDKLSGETLKKVKKMYELYIGKYEEACIYRDHSEAIRYAGYYNALELLLLGSKEDVYVNKIQKEVQDRRNKVIDLWHGLKK